MSFVTHTHTHTHTYTHTHTHTQTHTHTNTHTHKHTQTHTQFNYYNAQLVFWVGLHTLGLTHYIPNLQVDTMRYWRQSILTSNSTYQTALRETRNYSESHYPLILSANSVCSTKTTSLLSNVMDWPCHVCALSIDSSTFTNWSIVSLLILFYFSLKYVFCFVFY